MAQSILMVESLPMLILVVKLAPQSLPLPSPILGAKPIQMHVPIPTLLFISLGLRTSTPYSNMCHRIYVYTINHVHTSEANFIRFWKSNHTVLSKNNVLTPGRSTPKKFLKKIIPRLWFLNQNCGLQHTIYFFKIV